MIGNVWDRARRVWWRLSDATVWAEVWLQDRGVLPMPTEEARELMVREVAAELKQVHDRALGDPWKELACHVIANYNPADNHPAMKWVRL